MAELESPPHLGPSRPSPPDAPAENGAAQQPDQREQQTPGRDDDPLRLRDRRSVRCVAVLTLMMPNQGVVSKVSGPSTSSEPRLLLRLLPPRRNPIDKRAVRRAYAAPLA